MVQFSMWKKALVSIPRLKKDEWNELDLVSKWLIATRASVLIMTLMSSMIAGLLAWRDHVFELQTFLVVTFGLLLAHATNNLLNDFIDWYTGIDDGDSFRIAYAGGTHPVLLMRGGPREHFLYVLFTGLAALSCALWLVRTGGPLVPMLTVAGAFLVLGYTFPLKRLALGELAALLVWGPLMIAGGHATISGGKQWSLQVMIWSLPYALAVSQVLLAKHLDKSVGRFRPSVKAGLGTLPVFLGSVSSRRVLFSVQLSQYLLVLFVFVLSPLLSFSWDHHDHLPLLWLAMLALAFSWDYQLWPVFLREKPDQCPPHFPNTIWPLWYVAYAFRHLQTFGCLYFIALLLESVILR